MTPSDIHGHHGIDGGFSALPFIGSSILLLILVAALVGFFLWRHGRLPLPGLATRRSPEDQAKQILADRFARGDISTDDFMERSSILNWTPGSEALQRRRPRRSRH
jgi:putative membrane protein